MIRHNFQVEAGRESRFQLNPILSILLFLSLFISAEILSIPFSLLASYLVGTASDPLAQTLDFTLSYLMIPFGITMVVFMAFTQWIEKRPVRSLGFTPHHGLKKYLKGFVLGVSMMLAYMVLALALGTLKWSELSFQVNSTTVWLGVLIVLPGWIIQGASEEVLTRGWLYQSVSAKYGGFWGLLIAPTIFGALHLLNDNISLLSMVNLILFGVFAVFYVLADGGLWGICALHSAWNWAQGNLLGIQVSGTPVIGGSLIKPGPLYGSDLMTGAGFGAEGSLIVTGILVLGIVSLIYAIKKRPLEDAI